MNEDWKNLLELESNLRAFEVDKIVKEVKNKAQKSHPWFVPPFSKFEVIVTVNQFIYNCISDGGNIPCFRVICHICCLYRPTGENTVLLQDQICVLEQ